MMSKKSFTKQRRMIEMTRIGSRGEEKRGLGEPNMAQPQLKVTEVPNQSSAWGMFPYVTSPTSNVY